eukprot:SAG11_NODE_4488_length_1877_cov_1.387514_2_plen_58_part_00
MPPIEPFSYLHRGPDSAEEHHHPSIFDERRHNPALTPCAVTFEQRLRLRDHLRPHPL